MILSTLAFALAVQTQTPVQEKAVPSLDMASFAKIFSEKSTSPTIVLAPDLTQVPANKDAKDVDELMLSSKTAGFSTLRSQVGIVFQSGLPSSRWGVLRGFVKDKAPQTMTPKYAKFDASSLKDGMINFECKPGEVVSLADLSDFAFSKKFDISPYFLGEKKGDFPIAIYAKNMPEYEFIKALSRGLGGSLINGTSNYKLGMDTGAFKRDANKLFTLAYEGAKNGAKATQQRFDPEAQYEYQAQNYGQVRSNSKESVLEGIRLLDRTVAAMSDKQIEQTFAYSNTTTKLNLATFQNLQTSVSAYLKTMATGAANNSGRNINEIINRISPRNPGSVTISTNFKVMLELNVVRPPARGDRTVQTDMITIQVL